MSSSSTQTRDMVLFARGVIALLEGWDVLRLAITEGWGGPESAAKRTWLASIIVDEFEASSVTSPDIDYIADLIIQAMSDEFEVDVEDGSDERIADSIVKLWAADPATAAQMVAEYQATAQRRSKTRVQASREEGNGDSDWESESEDEDGVPRLIDRDAQPAAPREKPEPTVDDDGFTLVQGKGKGKH